MKKYIIFGNIFFGIWYYIRGKWLYKEEVENIQFQIKINFDIGYMYRCISLYSKMFMDEKVMQISGFRLVL